MRPPTHSYRDRLFVLITVFACCGQALSQSRVANNSDRQIAGLAHLEPQGGLILVGVRPGARILEITVEHGAQVAKGDLLATLEGHAQAQAQWEAAKLQLEEAQFQRSLKIKALKLERQRFDALKESRLAKLRELRDAQKAKLDVAVSNRERVSALDPTADRIAVQDFVINQSKSELLQTEMQLESFEQDLQMLPSQRELEDLEYSDENPRWKQLEAQVSLAQAAVEQTQIRAPMAGKVLDVVIHEGEVSAGPLLYLGDTTSMVAVVELFQTDVREIGIGDRASVEIFDQRVSGTVTRIGTLVGKNQITSVNPMALSDRRVVKVTVRLDSAQPAVNFVNMQVSVTITPKSAKTE